MKNQVRLFRIQFVEIPKKRKPIKFAKPYPLHELYQQFQKISKLFVNILFLLYNDESSIQI